MHGDLIIMKFKFKVLAASLALAVSLPASAAMTTGATGTTGDSALVLTLIDSTAGVSATFDLGILKSAFLTNANSTPINFSSGDYASAWTNFMGAATLSRVEYSVFAIDNLGSGAGARSLFTTANAGQTTFTSITTNAFATNLTNIDGYIVANNTRGNHNDKTDGGSYHNSTETGLNSHALSNTAFSSTGNKIGGINFDTTGLINTNLNVWNVASASSSFSNVSASKLSLDGFNPYFNLTDTGVLTYVAAVPEVDTSAMMIAGLGLMGFIARRRKSL